MRWTFRRGSGAGRSRTAAMAAFRAAETACPTDGTSQPGWKSAVASRRFELKGCSHDGGGMGGLQVKERFPDARDGVLELFRRRLGVVRDRRQAELLGAPQGQHGFVERVVAGCRLTQVLPDLGPDL